MKAAWGAVSFVGLVECGASAWDVRLDDAPGNRGFGIPSGGLFEVSFVVNASNATCKLQNVIAYLENT